MIVTAVHLQMVLNPLHPQHFVGQAVSAHGETDLVLLALEALRRMALQERVVDVVGWLMLAASSKKFVFLYRFSHLSSKGLFVPILM